MAILLSEPFPKISLQATNFRGVQTHVTNAQLKGHPFVLFVYPKDATCGCTLVAQGFSELYSEFRELGIEVYGLSRDTLRSHSKFIEKAELPFPLIADDGGNWMRAHDLIYASKMYGKPVTKVSRTTVFVDEAGIVQEKWENVSPEGHAQAVLESLRVRLSTGNAAQL